MNSNFYEFIRMNCERKMSEQDVLNITIEENVATISINRAKQSNSLSRAVFVSMREELEKMAYDDNVRIGSILQG